MFRVLVLKRRREAYAIQEVEVLDSLYIPLVVRESIHCSPDQPANPENLLPRSADNRGFPTLPAPAPRPVLWGNDVI